MPLIYDVKIESSGDKNRFRITWYDLQKRTQNALDNTCSLSGEKIREKWEKPQHQLEIGQALFRFLDGDARYFALALKKAYESGETLQINLQTCPETADWPFELAAKDGDFLLLSQLHLIRRVSNRGIERTVPPQDRPLRVLFMACDPLDLPSGLNYEQAEEEILDVTKKLPVELEVEDSGSLAGLQDRLMHKYYDVMHLSGHANIDGEKKPIFFMEDSAGNVSRTHPEEFWNNALIDNPPRLLFLSGCRTGQMSGADKPGHILSFAWSMVERFRVPAVLGWGRSVSDLQANHGEKMIYRELSRGRSIPEAVQRARYELASAFADSNEAAWPLLRLYSNGTPLLSIVKKEQRLKPKPRRITHAYLGQSHVKVLTEGFIGRRRQLQTIGQALDEINYNKLGVLLLGAGGLGKSCLIGKACERFPGHTLIALQGKLDEVSIGKALEAAFIKTGDDSGRRILANKTGMIEKLADLCPTSFFEKNYIILLDGFEQNLQYDNGLPGLVRPEAAFLLKTLLEYLHMAGRMTHLVITGRYSFTISKQGRDLIEEKLQKVWLTSLRGAELTRKIRGLPNIAGHKNSLIKEQLIDAGSGNPLLLEELNRLAGDIPVNETPRLQGEIEKTREDFIKGLGLYDFYDKCSEPLQLILKRLSIYDNPVPAHNIPRIEAATGIEDGQELLRQGMNLSLIEYDQAGKTYSLTPLLKERLKKEVVKQSIGRHPNNEGDSIYHV